MVVAMQTGVRTMGREAVARRGVAAGGCTAAGVARRRGRTRLTVRGRVVVAVLSALLAWACFGLVGTCEARSDMGATAVSSYTVRPGDTLWSYAARITPADGDVWETVAVLEELNDLPSSELTVGQRLIVPVW